MPAVLVTLGSETLRGLTDAIGTASVRVLERPLMRFAPPADWAALDEALAHLDRYQAVAITSPRAGEALAERLPRGGAAARAAARGLDLWASGSRTARPVVGWFRAVRLAGGTRGQEEGAAEALVRAILAGRRPARVLFPCGDRRRDALPDGLRSAGVTVDDVPAYRSVLADEQDARAACRDADVLVVGSPSVAALLARTCPAGRRPDLVTIGPVTAAAARDNGWDPAAIASSPTVEAVAAGVRALLDTR